MENFYQDSWIQFNKASIKVLIGMIVLLFTLATTYAWFTDSDNYSTETDTGNVYIELVTEISTIEIVAPNETISMESMVYVVGKPTTADAFIRVTYQSFIGSDEVTDLIQPILFDTFEFLSNGDHAWTKGEDGKYYYCGYTNEDTPVTFCNGFKVSEYLPKAYANKTVIFKIKAEAIQRNYRAYETGWAVMEEDGSFTPEYPLAWAEMLDRYDLNIDPEVEGGGVNPSE